MYKEFLDDEVETEELVAQHSYNSSNSPDVVKVLKQGSLCSMTTIWEPIKLSGNARYFEKCEEFDTATKTKFRICL